MSIEAVVEKISHNVVRSFNVLDCSFIREGYWADLIRSGRNVLAQIIFYVSVGGHCLRTIRLERQRIPRL